MKQNYINTLLRLRPRIYTKKIINIYQYPGARQHKVNLLENKIRDYKIQNMYPGARRTKYPTSNKENNEGRYPGARYTKSKNDSNYDIEMLIKDGVL